MNMGTKMFEEDQSVELYEICQPLLQASGSVKSKERALKRVEYALYRNMVSPIFWKGPGTPLSGAVRVQNEGLIGVLIEAKADVDEQDSKGVSSLHTATYEGHVNIMKLLLDFNATVNLVDGKGQTPLFFAPKAHICRLLATANADVSVLNDRGQSALHLAAAAGIGDVMTWFTQTASRALLRLRDARGLTASDYAAKSILRADLLHQFQRAVEPPNTKNAAATIKREVAESSAAKIRHKAATTIQRFVRGRITRRMLFGALSAAGMANMNQFSTRSFIIQVIHLWRNATVQGANARASRGSRGGGSKF
jgi:ankyrin repeat protein